MEVHKEVKKILSEGSEGSDCSSKASQNYSKGNRLPISSTLVHKLKRSLLSVVSSLYYARRISIFTPLFVLAFVGDRQKTVSDRQKKPTLIVSNR